MDKKTKANKVLEYKEYPVMSITRNIVRWKFGDKVADQMTDAMMKKLAVMLGDVFKDDDDIWEGALEGDVDFDGEFTITDP